MIHYRYDRARQLSAAARESQHPEPLAKVVDRTLSIHGVSPTRFGRDVMNDPRLVAELRAGRQPRPKTCAMILAHLDRIAAGKVVQHG